MNYKKYFINWVKEVAEEDEINLKKFYPQELDFLLLYIKTIYKGLISQEKGEVLFALDLPKRTENICYKIYWNNKDEIFIIPYWINSKDIYKIPYLFTNDPSGTVTLPNGQPLVKKNNTVYISQDLAETNYKITVSELEATNFSWALPLLKGD